MALASSAGTDPEGEASRELLADDDEPALMELTAGGFGAALFLQNFGGVEDLELDPDLLF